MKGMSKSRIFAAATLALGVLASTSACATGYAYGDRGRYGDRGYYADVERRAYDNGFREGVRAGENDARDNRRFDPSRHGDWRDADDGYRREYGDKNYYRRTFRNGYEAGYQQGFRRFDNGRYRR
jgi:hypothetical protein